MLLPSVVSCSRRATLAAPIGLKWLRREDDDEHEEEEDDEEDEEEEDTESYLL